MSMNMGKVVYWHKNQAIIRLKSQPAQSTSPVHTIETITTVIFAQIKAILKDLNLDMQLIGNPLLLLPTAMLLPPHSSIHSADNLDLVFFTHVTPSNMKPDMGPAQGNAGTADMGNDDHTVAVINQLNDNKNALQKALQDLGISADIAALPHWLWAGTDDQIHGCPTCPPIPVEDSNTPGQWKITLPQLSDSSLQDKTGEGVTVFVLDTLPSTEQIERAAKNAGNNLLLQKMTTSKANGPQPDIVPPAIKPNYSFGVPDPAESAVTGKDIYGRLVGFPMADHGLGVAGIIRDLAPAANIECIRVLNDYGVGDTHTLFLALLSIQERMLPNNLDTHAVGDLYRKPVVINLSLVVLPPDSDSPPEGVIGDVIDASRDLLRSAIQNLAGAGVIFVASAGNDSDPRDTKMNPAETRFGPRYPANFAYDNPPITTMIPVAAVNRKGDAAMYSNHPGPNGIATYSGELPRPDPWLPSAMSHVATRVAEPIDALRCVYTAQVYPALSVNDPHSILPASPSAYPMYEASSTWAYWSGTSFATPIISALAARILQGREPKSIDVRQAVINATTQQTMWTGVGDAKEDISSPMIMAVQEWQSANDTLIS